MGEKSGYKNLIVWQKGMDLARAVYALTEAMPETEKYGLISQMRRSAVSIPSNIAEGSKRNTEKDFKQFLAIAPGSVAELETQIELVRTLPFGETCNYVEADQLTDEITRMLTTIITKKLKTND